MLHALGDNVLSTCTSKDRNNVYFFLVAPLGDIPIPHIHIPRRYRYPPAHPNYQPRESFLCKNQKQEVQGPWRSA